MSTRWNRSLLLPFTIILGFVAGGCDIISGPDEENNRSPSASIHSPADASTFEESRAIAFEGSATDPEEGTLTGESLVWESSLHGQIGTGESFTRSDLPTGEHAITLTATDREGASDSDQMDLVVAPRATPSCGGGNHSWPIPGISRSRLGNDYAQYNWVISDPVAKHHTGMDIRDPNEPSVVPVMDGCVVRIQKNDEECGGGLSSICDDHGLGNTVIVRHELASEVVYSRYSHLARIDQSIMDACGRNTGTRITCDEPVEVSGGQSVLGAAGCTRYGLAECTSDFGAHLHLETRGGSLGDQLGTEGDDAGEFGYTEEPPEEYAFVDPLLIVHQANVFDQDLTVTVTTEGSGVSLRVGPGTLYRCFRETSSSSECRGLQEGDQFVTLAHVAGTAKCSNGWYRILSPDGEYFLDLSRGESSIPDGWVCSGDGGEVWVTENERPVATISSPTDGTTVSEGEAITFEGSAEDPEDGTLTGDALVWSSDQNGALGTSTSVTSSSLSAGTHTVTLTATDSDGAEGTDEISLTVDSSDGSSGSIALSDTVSGTIDPAGEVDEFTFEGEEGQEVAAFLQGLTGEFGDRFELRILDRAGTVDEAVLGNVAESRGNDDSLTEGSSSQSTGPVTLPRTDTYTVRVEGRNSTDDRGEYRFLVREESGS